MHWRQSFRKSRPGFHAAGRFLPAAALAAGLALLGATLSPAATASVPNILIFDETLNGRHDSIPTGIATIKELGEQNGFSVDVSEDPTAFTDDNLVRYDAVVWLNTTGDLLNDAQQSAFERYIGAGGGYVGVHSAAGTEYNWPWYGELLGAGARYETHPEVQQAEVVVEDHAHPSTAGLPARWTHTDEWFNYSHNPRSDVHVLLSLDESTYHPGVGKMGDHPIAWCQNVFQSGRSFYTGLGHTIESYSEPQFKAHLLGGIEYAARIKPGGCAHP